jgi:hypothetical protein
MGTFAETANFVYSLSFEDQGKQTSVFRLQQPRFKRETEAQSIFLDPFAVCSSCKWKFVCPFVNEETSGSYPFASGPNRLNGLSHPWLRQLMILVIERLYRYK